MSGRQRVLVVDDEPQILRALRTSLRGGRLRGRDGETAEPALAAAVRPPDAVILDLGCPTARHRRLPRAAQLERRRR